LREKKANAPVLENFPIHSIDVSAGFLLLLGLMVGMLSGLLGVGGGVLLTPALHILGMSMPLAVGTTLTQMVASSFTGAAKHFRQNNIVLPIALLLGIPALVGVWLGRNLMVFFDQQGRADAWTSALYIGFLLYIGYNMFRRSREPMPLASPGDLPKVSIFRKIWQLGPIFSWRGGERLPLLTPMFLGLIVGIISSLTGLGGGFFYVPVMVGFLHLRINQAVGTSLVCVFMGSLVGAIAYYQSNMVDLNVALYLAIGSSVGGIIGASATQFVKGNGIRYLFSFLVLMAAMSMIARRSGFLEFSYYLLFGSALIVVLSTIIHVLYHFTLDLRAKI